MNIEITSAHLCHLFPSARVVAVELDRDNARMCRINTEPWNDRCEVVEAAVWPIPGKVEYQHEAR